MPAGVEVFVEDGFATIDFVDREARAKGLSSLLENTPPGMLQTITRSGPRRKYRVPEGNAREAGLLDDSEDDDGSPRTAGKALRWQVEVTGDYTLVVDGVATTTLTTASTIPEIETALNATSDPVGFDVSGTSTDFEVDCDTPATLTATGGATVVVTEAALGHDTGFSQDLKDASPFDEADQSWHHPMPNVSDTAYGSGVGTITGPLRPNKAVDASPTPPPAETDRAELHADLQARVHDATNAITEQSGSEEPDESWTVDKLRAHARENDVNLEGATRKDDILDKIRGS